MGFAQSSRIARQFVSHGHITVNGRKVTIPSYHVSMGDVISIRQESKSKKIFEEIAFRLKKHEPPTWLTLDKEGLKGECIKNPQAEEIIVPFDVNVVGQFYAR